MSDSFRVVLLNIPCNFFILFVYVIIGLIIFGVYHDCVPVLNSKNEVNLYNLEDYAHVRSHKSKSSNITSAAAILCPRSNV